jgi:2-aminoethylphosphonate-pyruvate transaminase
MNTSTSSSLYPDNPYLLLTPGPLSTSKPVKAAMLRDWCTWDDDYNGIVESVRAKLVDLATASDGYTCVLMQGSGTFSVEAVIGSAIPEDGKLLVLSNGAYGQRIAKIAQTLRIPVMVHDSGEIDPTDLQRLRVTLEADSEITHVAVVHCETTTGMLNPVSEVGEIVKSYGKIFIVDAMSSFGGMEMDVADMQADFLISSANKCIQGVPGFGFIIAPREVMQATRGQARSLSLDMYDQWQAMDAGNGKWRFTSPTHVVRAFSQALKELDAEGGVAARASRYRTTHRALVDGMRELGFETLLSDENQSPIITSFMSPDYPKYNFKEFYQRLKDQGFVIYPGKISDADTFRIGNIGEIYAEDIARLMSVIEANRFWHIEELAAPDVLQGYFHNLSRSA